MKFLIQTIRLLLLLGVTPLFLGCHRQGTSEQREQSMAMLREEGFDTRHLENLITARTGLLNVGDGLVHFHDDNGQVYGSTMVGKVSHGMATLITNDGYALTAAHCVEKGKVIAAYVQKQGPEGKQILLLEGRQVWTGTSTNLADDLALLKFDAPAHLHCFSWAPNDEIATGSRVLLAGQQVVKSGNPLTLGAGYVRDRASRRASSADAMKMRVIAFDGPGRRGDSGGALTDSSGQLLGIVVGYHAPLFSPGYGVAIRPDMDRLEQLIQQDRLRFAKPAE